MSSSSSQTPRTPAGGPIGKSASTGTYRPPSVSSFRPSSAARPGSSASIRPSSSSLARTLSGGPSRPSSAASLRPSSSSPFGRPLSSASARSSSRLTQRPSSRHSHRPSTRQSARLAPQFQTLVTQVTQLTVERDRDAFFHAVDYVSRNLDLTVRPGTSNDLQTVERRMQRHMKKARINTHDNLASALDQSLQKLKGHLQSTDELDAEIKMSRLPDHLQFLMLLSKSPSQATVDCADEVLENIRNPPKAGPGLTWKDILAEEPFEGQHWEGAYGLPPGSTVEDWETRSGTSTPSLSPFDDSDFDESTSSDNVDMPGPLSILTLRDPVEVVRAPAPTYAHRADVEKLVLRQYWKSDWRIDTSTERPFDIRDTSTLGPSIHRALSRRTTLQIDGSNKEQYINEHDAVREVLMGLQGRRNLAMNWVYTGDQAFSFVPSPGVRLLHLSVTAQLSIMLSFCQIATAVEHLRKFIAAVFAKVPQARFEDGSEKPRFFAKRGTLTLEAFADALDAQVRAFYTWCASKEEEMCFAEAGLGEPLVVSLLSLEKSIRDKFSVTFTVILDILRGMVQQALRSPNPVVEVWILPEVPVKMTPSASTTALLDRLLNAVQEHTSMGDMVTSDALLCVFGDTAEPIWSMVGRWMREGMPLQEIIVSDSTQGSGSLDDEFFVEDNEMPVLDPDFWADGFVLRDSHVEDGESKSSSVPTFLVHVAQHILATGKAVGLLRALDIPLVGDGCSGRQWITTWATFRTLVEAATQVAVNTTDGKTAQRRSATTSTDNLSRLIYDELSPYSTMAQDLLARTLVDECDMWAHLSAIEDLYLMRRGDSMSHFLDSLFARMDSHLPWGDFHFLNSAFRDIADAGSQKWIDASLVRISHRGSKDRNINRTVRAIDGFIVEYAIPFPLTYIFTPRTMQVYSAIFAFILQIRRAKSVLERILVRADVGQSSRNELKVFYAMRSKLSWFVNTLLSFIATNVIHAQLLSFHGALRQAKSIDEIIQVHNYHLSKIESRCLLQRNTSALHRTIISILDMVLVFSESFVAFAGDTTHDISRHSISMVKQHRSRRVRRQRRNVIGFSTSFPDAGDSSDSDSEFDPDLTENGPEPLSFSVSTSTAFGPGEDFLARLDKISTELDMLVRFIRRGVESLAAGTSEAASAFGIFAFSLEDWDR